MLITALLGSALLFVKATCTFAGINLCLVLNITGGS
jgi:hypothetical protein